MKCAFKGRQLNLGENAPGRPAGTHQYQMIEGSQRIEKTPNGIFLREIQRRRFGPAADDPKGRIEFILLSGCDGDMCAFRRQKPGSCQAHSGTSTQDNDFLVFQHMFLLSKARLISGIQVWLSVR